MFKKSFYVVLIQILGALLGLVSIYLIAGNMEPEVYSLVGVYTVISGVTLTFSDFGLETTMMREALYWIEKYDNDKVSEYATQAMVSRIIAFFLLFPFLVLYVLLLNHYKYDGQYLFILLLFVIGAEVNSLNNAMSLIVRAQGGYVFAQFASTINNYFLKFAGIGLYFVFGYEVYLIFYGVSSVPLSIVYLIKQKNVFKFKYIKIKSTFKKVWEARYLWLKTDLDYFKNNADSLLVSTLFPAAIMGAYSIYKQLEQLSKNFIEGFFDVLSQHSVMYKGNREQLEAYEKRFKKARNIVIILVCLGMLIFIINPDFFIRLVHLENYVGMKNMILCVALVSVVHLIGKYEINALAFFATSKLNFYIGIVVFFVSIISFVLIILIPTVNGMLVQRIVIFAFMSLLSKILFSKHKEQLYTEVLK